MTRLAEYEEKLKTFSDDQLREEMVNVFASMRRCYRRADRDGWWRMFERAADEAKREGRRPGIFEEARANYMTAKTPKETLQ